MKSLWDFLFVLFCCTWRYCWQTLRGWVVFRLWDLYPSTVSQFNTTFVQLCVDYFERPVYPSLGHLSTCSFTRLEESNMVPAGFLTAQFLKKTRFMKPWFFGGKFGGASLCCLPGEKEKYCKARRVTNGIVFTLLFLHWSHEQKIHLSCTIKTKAL